MDILDQYEEAQREHESTVLAYPASRSAEDTWAFGTAIQCTGTEKFLMCQAMAMDQGVMSHFEISSLIHEDLLSDSNMKLYCSEQVHCLAKFKWGDRLRLAQVRAIHNREARRLIKAARGARRAAGPVIE